MRYSTRTTSSREAGARISCHKHSYALFRPIGLAAKIKFKMIEEIYYGDYLYTYLLSLRNNRTFNVIVSTYPPENTTRVFFLKKTAKIKIDYIFYFKYIFFSVKIFLIGNYADVICSFQLRPKNNVSCFNRQYFHERNDLDMYL